MTTCNCIGPQFGQPLCPCQMRSKEELDRAVDFIISHPLPEPTRDARLPPWTDQILTPKAVIAYLTYDPATRANMGEGMADHVIAALNACGFEIVSTAGRDDFGPSHASRLTK